MSETYCHCGRPLHYSLPTLEFQMKRLVEENGEYMPVTDSNGHTYLVQRHYIALHGLHESELEELGFLKNEKRA